jgi:hypothetical protein
VKCLVCCLHKARSDRVAIIDIDIIIVVYDLLVHRLVFLSKSSFQASARGISSVVLDAIYKSRKRVISNHLVGDSDVQQQDTTMPAMKQAELEYDAEPSVEPEVRACVASLVSAVRAVAYVSC